MMIQGYISLFVFFIITTALLYLPIFFRLRKKEKGVLKPIGYLLCLWSLFLVIFATIILFNLPIRMNPERHIVNLRPFQWLYEGNIEQRIRTEIGPNIMLFIPLGFFLPVAFRRMRKAYRTALSVLAVTFGVEFLQYFIGRSSDVDDLIANLLGGLMGYGLFKLCNHRFI